ncbi:alpha/beta hydrolase [Marimonas arenosa]|uniref:Alpha/beta hydrolase n=1 Tax=Marimonas arenosa TaxID=1795305 RepID=A0AAE4B208_9RHOB|nr:alpha/beta hydrolase [Marimonas arenosa]MDQ2088578.1 alpha/beta hydrolase [Marimonas arenosa]
MSRLRVVWAAAKMALPAPLQHALYAGRLHEVDGRRMDASAQIVGELATLLRGGDSLPTVEESRTQMDAMVARFDRPCPDNIARHDLTLPGAAGSRPARIYVSRGADPYAVQPTLIYLHGGGWVQGGLASHDGTCGALAERAGIRVIAYDYRLAPEHPFPSAPDDVRAAYLALLDRGGDFGIAPDRLAVGGDSAGANLTSVLIHDLAEAGAPPPAAQLLIYPAVDARMQTPAMESLRDAFVLPKTRMEWYLKLYLGQHGDLSDPRVSPVLSPYLAGQPPALIIAAGHDPLRDDAYLLAEALDKAGGQAELVEFEGQVHAFISLTRVIPEGRAALDRAGDWLAAVLR